MQNLIPHHRHTELELAFLTEFSDDLYTWLGLISTGLKESWSNRTVCKLERDFIYILS